MHGPVLHLESPKLEARKLHGFECGGGEVLHAAASNAVEMMMASLAKLEARSSPGMREAAREPELNQCVQDPVDRRPRNAGHPLAHGLEQVLGTRMIPTRRQGLHHCPSLDRQRQTALSTRQREPLEGTLDRVDIRMHQTGNHCI